MNQAENDNKITGFKFSSFTDKEKGQLIADNFEKLGLHIIDWKEKFEVLERSISATIEESGFVKPFYGVDSYKRFHLDLSVIVENILYTIDILLKTEKHNKEVFTMLQKAKESYQVVINSTDETYFILAFDEDTNEVVIEEKIEYIAYIGLDEDEIKERIEFIKENTSTPDILKLIKKIELANLYGSKFDNKVLAIAFANLIVEKKNELNEFKLYVNDKIKMIQKMVYDSNKYVGSYQHFKDYLNEYDDVLFDKDGKLTP
jgi:hypothetical protein